ncbi:MAG: hypothetical protein ACHQ7N_09875 [Candidatus Methylomirabilales bacterium]
MPHAPHTLTNEELASAIAGGQPEAVLSLLEPDQLVAAKARTRFGPRRLTRGVRALLWGLRIYVLVMLALVLLQVLQAVQGAGH